MNFGTAQPTRKLHSVALVIRKGGDFAVNWRAVAAHSRVISTVKRESIMVDRKLGMKSRTAVIWFVISPCIAIVIAVAVVLVLVILSL